MKANELEIMKLANNYGLFETPIKEYPRKMSQFDAYNKDCIVEIKHRDSFWDDALIEFGKYSFNKEFAKLNKLNSLYLKRMANRLVIFDILYLESINYDFKWEWKDMPKNTEFGNNEMIPKFVGYINVKDACENIEIV